MGIALAGLGIAVIKNRPLDGSLNHYQLGVAVITLMLLQPFSSLPHVMTHHVRTPAMDSTASGPATSVRCLSKCLADTPCGLGSFTLDLSAGWPHLSIASVPDLRLLSKTMPWWPPKTSCMRAQAAADSAHNA